METGIALDDEQSLTRHLFELSPDCLKLLDIDGCILHMNKNGRAALELDDFKTVEDQPWASFWPEHKRATVLAALEKARVGGSSRLIDSCPTFKGHEKYWDIIISRVGGVGGTPRRLMVASRDVTDIKQAEYDLRASEAKSRVGLDIAGVGIATIDYRADTIILDERSANLFGLRPGAAHSRRDVHSRFHPDDQATVKAAIDDALASPQADVLSIEHRLLTPNGEVRWISARKHIFFEFDADGARSRPSHGLLAVRDISERKSAQARITDLMNEVNHRSKNLLSVVQAVARQTARGGSAATFLDRLTARISGLASSQDLMIQNSWRGVGLADLVAAQLAHFKDRLNVRITIEGPPITVSASAAQAIGMAMFELGTNAAKYGALSNDSGCVRISWTVDPTVDTGFAMTWEERGGPTVVAPTHTGFGQLVIVTMVEGAVGGAVELGYLPSGIRWRFEAPLQRIRSEC